METREQRGLELAATRKLQRKGRWWVVPLRSGTGSYVVATRRPVLAQTMTRGSLFGVRGIAFVLGLCTSLALLGPGLLFSQETVRVVRVIDGDTIEACCLNGRPETIRYIGVNTPETNHPTKGLEAYGKEAKEANSRLVAGKTVRLELDVDPRDRNGRLLAYVYLEDGTFVNAWLVKQGYAQVMTVPPNMKYQELFLRLQREAREAGRGLWR